MMELTRRVHRTSGAKWGWRWVFCGGYRVWGWHTFIKFVVHVGHDVAPGFSLMMYLNGSTFINAMNFMNKKILSVMALSTILMACGSDKSDPNALQINPANMQKVSEVSPRYQSYNVEMVEVVGGEFWRPYSQMEQDEAGNPILPELGDGYDVSQKNEAMYMKLDPLDLSNPRIIALAQGLAPAYMRVSGTWANGVYFQNDDKPQMEKAPEGFVNVLTKGQWKGVVDFSKVADAEIVTSFAVSNGVRDKEGVWTPVQAQQILDYTKELGGSIAAAELFNEPTMPSAGGAIDPNYNAESYAKDMDVFYKWAKAEAPEMIVLAPGTVGEGLGDVDFSMVASGNAFTAEELLSAEPRTQMDAFSFHHYGAASMRMFRDGHPFSISKENALSKEWIERTDAPLEHYKQLRDKYAPGKQLWNTETAEAAGGGDPFAATYLDTFRYLYQLASNARNGLYVHMHNTLIASEYSLVDQTTLEPKPNYWAAYLWAQLMGTDVLDAGKSQVEGVYLFAHNRKGSNDGVTFLVINTTENPVSLNVAADGQKYVLTATDKEAKEVQLNGKTLSVGADHQLPTLNGVDFKAGAMELPALSSTFLTF